MSNCDDYNYEHCPTCNSNQNRRWFKRNQTYQISICGRCSHANQSGWSLAAERVLIPHMQSLGLSLPERNSEGWLPYEDYQIVEVIPE